MPAKQRRRFFPSELITYEQCPERYFHEYVEERPKPEDFFEPALERGSAIHKVLSEVAVGYQEHGAIPSDIRERASIALKRAKYPSDEEWQRDLEMVIRDIEYGLSLFDGRAEVLSVETKYYREFPETEHDPRFVLAAKIDLVLHRCDDDGLLIIDVVDFKSGKGTSNPVQEYVCQSVVENHAPRYRVPFNYIQNTIVRTSVGEVVSSTSDEVEGDYQHEHVVNLVKAIYEDTSWQPKESPRCRRCPYREDGCSLSPSVNGPDEFGDRLYGIEG